MGTHPIFESDFDCLTDTIMDLSTIEWIIMAAILTSVISIGIWNSKRGHVTGPTYASLFELSISTCVTFSSSVAMMGVPGETFKIGPRYGIIILSYPIFTFILSKWAVEAYRKNSKVKSVFDFIQIKFDEKTKKIALLIYILQSSIYLSVTIYAPALALSTFIPIELNHLLLILFMITIFVSSVGGIRAVFTTDAFFGLVMFIGQIGILIHSILRIQRGSPLSLVVSNFTAAYVNETNDMFKISFFEKFGFWDLTIGVTFMCCYLYGANHAGVLRILSAKSDKTAKIALIINAIGLSVILIIGVGFGFVVKSHYGSLPAEIKSSDQLLIAYIVDTYADIPILRGLFIGAVISAALSTSSSIIISITDCIHYDFLSFNKFGPILKNKMGKNFAPRLISILVGFVCFAAAIIVAKLGNTVIHLAFANFGICGGPFLGLICLAIQERWIIDSNVASASTVTSLILTGIGGFGGIFGIEQFRISPLWWTPIGCLTNLFFCFVGTIIQNLLKQNHENHEKPKPNSIEIHQLLQNKI